MGSDAETKPPSEPASEPLSEVLRLLREYGVLDRTHVILANGVQIQMALPPPEVSREVPLDKNEMLRRALRLPAEEPPRS